MLFNIYSLIYRGLYGNSICDLKANETAIMYEKRHYAVMHPILPRQEGNLEYQQVSI